MTKTTDTTETARPSLCTIDPQTGNKLEIAFGYLNGEPVAALFIGDDTTPAAFLDRDFLEIASSQGWAD